VPELIDLHHMGHERTVASYLLDTDDGPALFDCGPTTTIDALKAGLAEREVALGDPSFERIRDIHDVNSELRDEIEHFFQRYKDLEPTKRTETRGWGNRSEAAEILAQARARR